MSVPPFCSISLLLAAAESHWFESKQTCQRREEFLAQKSLVELGNMYKSEEQIQEKLEAEDALLRGAKNQRIASDWDKLLGDLEEGDRVLATGTGGEIWD